MDFGSGLTANVFPVLTPSLFQYPQAIKSLKKERIMNPLLIIAIPLGLVILGMILNNFGLSFAYPPSSAEQDPAKRVVAERDTYHKFFDLQRSQSMKRQKSVGQFGWLLMAAFIGAFIWLYTDTVNKTSLSSRIAALQTLGTEEGKQMVRYKLVT